MRLGALLAGLVALVLLAGPGTPAWAQQSQSTQTQQGAFDDGKATGQQLNTQAQTLPQQEPTAETLPGYQGAPGDLTGLYGSDDAALNSAGATGVSNETFNQMRSADANRSRIPASATDDIRQRGEEINADPQLYATGTSASGQQGSCQAITRPGQASFYEATCNVGAAVTASKPSCQITLDHHFSQSYGYTCSDVKLTGTLCISAWGIGCLAINYTASSGCKELAAAGCSLTSSSSNTFFTYSGLNYVEGSYNYSCASPVAYSVTGTPLTVNGATYMGSASGPTSVPGYINSTQNVSQCADNQLTGCPAGSSLEGAQCVRRQPASLTYVCESGWALAGTTCSQTIVQPAALAGLNCPAGYALQGELCVGSVPATPSYSCPSGWTLQGTNCTMATSHPASGVWTCPAGWSLSGSTCYQAVDVAADVTYCCPVGSIQSGSSCTTTTSHPASPDYFCPAGWTLDGTTCKQDVSSPALAQYECPAGWSLNGTTCELNETTPATGTAQCPAGYSYDGTNCVLAWSVAATPNYACEAGWTLNGTLCETYSNYSPTITPTCSDTTSYDEGVTNLCEVDFPLPALCPRPNYEGLAFVRSQLDKVDTYQRLCWYQPVMAQSCPNGGVLSNNLCVITTASVAAAVSYTCAAGTLAGDQCLGSDIQAPTGTGYSCPAGWTLSGAMCLRSSSQPASVTYSCAAGLTLSGTTCIGTLSQPASIGYSCTAGEVLVGDQCTATQSQPAAPVYSCPAGLTLNGTRCTGTLSQAATLGYECAAGETLSGDQCLGTTSKNADVSYSCASGTLTGDQCSVTAVPTPAGFDCPPGYSQTKPGFCTRTETVSAGANYACPADMALSGSECLAFSNPVSNPSAECTIESEVCSDASPQTRIVDGVAITQACWAWTRTYNCNKVTEGNNDCGDYASNPQCTFVRDDCLDDPPSADGSCRVKERIYSCPVPGDSGPPQSEMVCNGDVYCVNGVCEQVEREASNELKDALIGLGAIDQTSKDFDPANMTLFKGTRETCHKPVFGLVNCCAGKTSGLLSLAAGGAALAGGPAVLAGVATQFLTLFLCSTQEKMLDVKDRMGLCHYVGTYCSSSFLGICTTKKKTYCCFQSKLTRILQVQGRPQIGKPWGPPKTEQCAGFTPDEFSRLDLAQMDFSEIYNEMLEAVKLPDEVQMAGEIQAKIRAYYQQNGGQ